MSVIEAAAVAVDAVGKPLYIGEYGGPPPNFTGPSVEHQAFPRALLNWQVEQQQRGRRARLRTLSSIWGWMCPAKRDSMRCIWGDNSTEWRSGEEGAYGCCRCCGGRGSRLRAHPRDLSLCQILYRLAKSTKSLLLNEHMICFCQLIFDLTRPFFFSTSSRLY